MVRVLVGVKHGVAEHLAGALMSGDQHWLSRRVLRVVQRWLSHPVRRRMVCFVLILFGGTVKIVSHEPHGPWPWPLPWLALFADEFGVAIFIAGLLGLCVEPFFKGEFGRDVFEAAYRYVLPEELRDAAGRILRQQLVGETQVWTVKVYEEEDKAIVLVMTSVEKTIVNKSNEVVKVQGPTVIRLCLFGQPV